MESLKPNGEVNNIDLFDLPDDVNNALDEFYDHVGEDRVVYDKIVSRLRDETDFLRIVEELGLLEKMFDNNPELEGIENVFHGNVPIIKHPIKGYKSAITDIRHGIRMQFPHWFKPRNRDIHIRCKAPKPDLVIYFLCTGEFPDAFNSLCHEFIHSFQYLDTGDKQLNMKLIKQLNNENTRPLKEVHANIFSPNFIDNSEIRRKLGGGIYKYDTEMIDAAIELVRMLEAMKVSAREIGEMIIYYGLWDDSARDYSELREQVKILMDQKGIDESQIKDMLLKHQEKRVATKQKVAGIAREEVLKHAA